MLHIQIDTQSGMPAYKQLVEQMTFYVASGVLGKGEQLPSIRDLARQLAVNPSTVVKAYNELRYEGIVELQRGKGAFVSGADQGLTKRARRNALRPVAQRLAVGVRQMGMRDEDAVTLLREELAMLKEEEHRHEDD